MSEPVDVGIDDAKAYFEVAATGEPLHARLLAANKPKDFALPTRGLKRLASLNAIARTKQPWSNNIAVAV